MVGRIRAGRGCMRVAGNCLKYLKRGWNRKEGKGSKYSFNWRCEATLKQRWDNVISTLKRHCAALINGCIDVVQRRCNVVSTLDMDIVSMLRNIENPISNFFSFSTLDQRYLNGNLQCWNNVDTTLKCWQGSIYEKVNSKEKLILWKS